MLPFGTVGLRCSIAFFIVRNCTDPFGITDFSPSLLFRQAPRFSCAFAGWPRTRFSASAKRTRAQIAVRAISKTYPLCDAALMLNAQRVLGEHDGERQLLVDKRPALAFGSEGINRLKVLVDSLTSSRRLRISLMHRSSSMSNILVAVSISLMAYSIVSHRESISLPETCSCTCPSSVMTMR